MISLYWFPAQQCTSTLRRQKNGLLDVNFKAEFNEISLFSFPKATGKSQKITKTRIVWKNANCHLSEAKGLETGQDFAGSPKRKFFWSCCILFSLSR